MAQRKVIIFWFTIVILLPLISAGKLSLRKSILQSKLRLKRSLEDRFSFPSDRNKDVRNSYSSDVVTRKPNSFFNRLAGRISVNDNIDDYDDHDVQPDNQSINNDYEDISRRRHRYKPCIAVPYGSGYGYNYGRAASNRNPKTFFDYNVNYIDYNVNAPVNVGGGGGGYKPQYEPVYQEPVESTPIVQAYPQRPIKPIKPQFGQGGGYICLPNYNGGGYRPQRPFKPNRPQGGPFGFFGQGGLFDFNFVPSGGSGISQIAGAAPAAVDEESETAVGDDVRPVYEINVPDAIQTVVRTDTRYMDRHNNEIGHEYTFIG